MAIKLELVKPYIDPEKLPYDYQALCEIVGLEKTLAVADEHGGTSMYLEKLQTILMPFIRLYVIDQFKQSEGPLNVRRVAREMGISQETVYEILRNRHGKGEDKSGWQQEALI